MALTLTPRWGGAGPFLAGVATSALAFTMIPAIPMPSLIGPVRAISPVKAKRFVLPAATPGLPEDPDLQRLVQAPLANLEAVGTTAQMKNDALPIARNASFAAAPFTAVNMASGSGQTALQCLTQAVYYEAAYESLPGRRAVAQVVLNRLRHPAFPKTVCGVVYQGSTRPGCQFSFTCDGSLRRQPEPQRWAEARQVAAEALEGHVETSVGYATHYHANYVYPYWAPKLVKLARIGAHIFYRWPGGWGTPGAFQGQYAGFETIPAWRQVYNLPKSGNAAAATVGTDANGAPVAAVSAVASAADTAGRIDTSTGWRVHMSDANELNHSSLAAIRRQSGVNALLQEAAGDAKP
jgi:spore germination cell wall hydrolase CwlJ-like protein